MVIDFNQLRHLSQFSVPLLLAALVVIFFHNGNASFNLQLDADQRLKAQHESLQDIQAIFLDYLIEIRAKDQLTGDALPMSVSPQFEPRPDSDSCESESDSFLAGRRERKSDRPGLLKRFKGRNH